MIGRFLRRRGAKTTAELAAETGRDVVELHDALLGMEQSGLLERIVRDGVERWAATEKAGRALRAEGITR